MSVLCVLLMSQPGVGQDVEQLLSQGKTLRMEGKKRRSVQAFAKALEHTPGHVECLVQMGAALEDQGKWRQAVKSYKRALQIDPTNLMAGRNLRQLLSSRAVNRPLKAPNPSREHLIQTGLQALDRGDLNRALEVFRLARGLMKDDPRPLLYSAAILERSGKVRHAIALYERTVKAFPAFVPARINLVIALLTSGDNGTALKRARESVIAIPDDRRLKYLARLCDAGETHRATTRQAEKASNGNRSP
jgi:Flp pilus assembly protein TadD